MHLNKDKLASLIPLAAEIIMCIARNLVTHNSNSYTSVPLSGQQEDRKDPTDT